MKKYLEACKKEDIRHIETLRKLAVKFAKKK